MKILHRFPISLRTRFIVGMAAMFLPIVILGIGAFFSLESAVGNFDQVVEDVVDGMVPIVHLQILILRASKPVSDYIIYHNPAERRLFVQLSREVDRSFKQALSAPFVLAEYQALVRNAQEEWQQARNPSEAILDLSRAKRDPVAPGEMKRLQAHIDRAVDTLDQVHHLIHQEIDKRLASTHAAKGRVLLIVVIGFGAGLGIAILVGTVLARSFLLPLRVLGEGADRFGEGNLSYRVPLYTKNELGQLARGFNAMAEKLEKSQAALQYLSIRDDLTGLYNRRHFELLLKEEMERWRRYGHPFSLLMLDIDHFKDINDTYGHRCGDEVLHSVAKIVSGAARPIDRVCRYGGEEFTILLAETASAGGLAMAERIREAVGTQTIHAGQRHEIKLTVSIGVAAFPEEGKSEDELIAAADQALYMAKNAGRNRVCRQNKS
ncbi:MAG TPA: diguanylate cyclase [bacterium]|nr:diguanylate cyclase [bacterium]